MTDLGMRAIDAAVKLAIENDAATDAGSHRDVDQSITISPRAPSGFGQSGGVTVVLQSDLDVKHARKIADRALSSPAGKKIYVTKLAAHGIHRTR